MVAAVPVGVWPLSVVALGMAAVACGLDFSFSQRSMYTAWKADSHFGSNGTPG